MRIVSRVDSILPIPLIWIMTAGRPTHAGRVCVCFVLFVFVSDIPASKPAEEDN